MSTKLVLVLLGIGLFVMGMLFFNILVYIMSLAITSNFTWFLKISNDSLILTEIFESAFAVILLVNIRKYLSLISQ